MSFSLPKEWQDWLNLLLGIWVCLSPWALKFADNASATRTAVVVGFLIIASQVFTVWALRLFEEWINVVLGAWLVISAWLLEAGAPIANVNFTVAGLAVVGLAVYEIWDARRHPIGSV